MDKENPLIHKIEELEGKYVPFFEWKYDISEIVEDFTTYTYRINMMEEFVSKTRNIHRKESIHWN